MNNQSEDMHPVPKLLTFVLASFFIIYGLWGTIVAFTGGTLPILGISLQGGIMSGLLWLFIIDPILMTVGYWISMVLVLPVAFLIDWLGD